MSNMSQHIANVRHHAADMSRSAAFQRAVEAGEARDVELRTRFCTAKGWFAYRDLTPALRRAVLSAEGGVGPVGGWVSTQVAKRLEAMGLVERRGPFVRLSYHGELLWCELDDPR